MKRIVIFTLILSVAAAVCFGQDSTWTLPEWTTSLGDRHTTTHVFCVGVSERAATERLARTRALEVARAEVARKMGSEIFERTVTTARRFLDESGMEPTLIERMFTDSVMIASVRARPPRLTEVEWHIVSGVDPENNRNWHQAYVLVRYQREQIITMVENINPETVADNIARECRISRNNIDAEARAELVAELMQVRNEMLSELRAGDVPWD
jgi:hypothetical protein